MKKIKTSTEKVKKFQKITHKVILWIGIPISIVIGSTGFFEGIWGSYEFFSLDIFAILIIIAIILSFIYKNKLYAAITWWIFSSLIVEWFFISFLWYRWDSALFVYLLIVFIITVIFGIMFFISWNLKRKSEYSTETEEQR